MGNCASGPKTDEREVPMPEPVKVNVEQQDNKVGDDATTEEIPVSTHTHSLATLLNEKVTWKKGMPLSSLESAINTLSILSISLSIAGAIGVWCGAIKYEEYA
ncbi:hypothetical protein Fmac_010083 [Flemingia macrophylla]|uniref:Uncharacterized protein n=1 Tax=Flemingia macrophylla TaxID=520843 RepID=A0ABD1N286_9FABA